MKRLFSTQSLIATVIAFGAIGATSVAQARADVQYRVAVGEPHGQHQYYERNDRRGGPLGDADRDGVPNMYDRDSRFFDWRATQRSAEWGDFDRDGVVNKFDRAPRNPRRH